MNRIIYILTLLMSLSIYACHEVESMSFQDEDRIQFQKNSSSYNIINFYYQDRETVRYDTFYLTVNTIGMPRPYDRPLCLEQNIEYTTELITNTDGQVTDTVYTEITNKAIPGIHFIDLNDPSMLPYLKIKSNQVTAEIPIILLRDKTLKDGEVRLVLTLKENKDFSLGERDKLSQTLIISDELLKPSNWSKVSYEFGIYSVRKHEFMIEVTGEQIDEQWINRINTDYSEVLMYRNRFANKLEEFNTDPVNIAAGTAPMKDENNKEINF